MAVANLSRRQAGDGYYYGGYYYSQEAYIIKWVVVGVFFLVLALFFIGGYMHAKKRMKKGLPPLSYHRWLIRRRDREAWYHAHPEHPNPYAPRAAYYVPGVGQTPYPMQPMYGPPPPTYGTPEYLPAYTPPPGASKANPDQTWTSPPPPAGSGMTYTIPSQPTPAHQAGGNSNGRN